MSRYTRDQVKAMTRDVYESVICNELNAAGFRSEFQGEYFEYEPDEFVFGGSVVFDPNAVNYLKKIGLIDNGKCPMCSEREEDLQYKLQNQNSGVVYHVCKSCYKKYAKQERAKRGCISCLVIIVIIALLIWGIIKLMN